MPKRPVWSGSITFGLVNIPVRLFNAVSEDRVAFHLLHDEDKLRLHRKYFCPADGKDVHLEHLVKGFEVEKDRFVVVRDEELEACAPKLTKAIEISDFVDLDEIDPVYLDRAYYVLPQAGAGKSYRLLVEAMRKTKKVGIAKFVMHEKEYLVGLRITGDAICLQTMHFAGEVLPSEDVVESVSHDKPEDRELKVAEQLIESMSAKFKPEKYHDEYKEQVRELVEQKTKAKKHEDVVTSHPPEAKKKKAARATDLMAALEASLAQAKSAAGHASHPRRRKSA